MGASPPASVGYQMPYFVTGFSPTDVERDIKSMSHAPGVAGEFDWVITPGENAFGSENGRLQTLTQG